MRVVDVAVGAERTGEEVGHIAAEFMYGRHHDVRGALVVELLDSFAQIGLIYFDAVFPHEFTHAAFIHGHAFAFGDHLDIVAAEDVKDNLVMFLGIARPVDVDSVGFGIGGELLEIPVEVGKRMEFYLRCQLAHLFPFGDCGCHLVTAHACCPQATVVHLAVCTLFYELGSEFYLIHLLHGCASPFKISVI